MNCVGFGIGGNDSTASAITSVLYLLTQHQDVQTKVQEELDHEAHDTSKMKYLSAVIKESLRLYPPFPMSFSRVTQLNDTICEYSVPAKVNTISISI